MGVDHGTQSPLTIFFTVFSLNHQTYVTSSDKDFVAATIQAIGRCASNISEVTDTCMNGLMGLMANRDGKGLCMSMFTWFESK